MLTVTKLGLACECGREILLEPEFPNLASESETAAQYICVCGVSSKIEMKAFCQSDLIQLSISDAPKA